jgi:penicillin-binding protein 1C
VVVAAQLERSWTKSQILEAYLNSVPFRGEVVGINALSQTLFGKHPSGLDAARGRHRRGPGARPQCHHPTGWPNVPAACCRA